MIFVIGNDWEGERGRVGRCGFWQCPWARSGRPRPRSFALLRTTLAGLWESVRDEPVDAGTVLARIRRRREGIGEVDVREATLRILRDAGLRGIV